MGFVTLGSNSAVGGMRMMISLTGFSRRVLGLVAANTYMDMGKIVIRSMNSKRGIRIRTHRVRILNAYSGACPLRGGKRSVRFLHRVTRLHPHAGAFNTIFHVHRGVTVTVRRFFRREKFFCFRAPVVATSSYRKTNRVFRIAAGGLCSLGGSRANSVVCSSSFFKGRTDLAISKRLRNRLTTATLKTVCAFKPAFHTRGSGAPHRLTRF